MHDLLSREILARAYIQDALDWSRREHLAAQARAHARRPSRGSTRLHAAIPSALKTLARRLTPLRAVEGA
jgi:phage gp46-like protein